MAHLSVLGAAALTAALLSPSAAFAAQETFHDAHNDVARLSDDTVVSARDGIDVRRVRVTFTDRAVTVVTRHRNLTNTNAHDTAFDVLYFDLDPANRGPERAMRMVGFNYWLYTVNTFAQADDPAPRMARFCGDRARIRPGRDLVRVRLPVRCFPRATRVRVAGRYVFEGESTPARYDDFLGYREWTGWVQRG